MFLDFYGLKEQPFGVTPDPRFLYMSPSHREALASLYCAIENNRGFSAMVAPPGMGKTSLLFRLLETVKGKARTAFLFHPDANPPQFFQSLLLDIGLDGNGTDFVKMRESLNHMLLEERRAGRRFVLVVDEAQNLSSEILESVRLLSNFETPREKLMHIVLVGQPRLAETLQRRELNQLSQRVSTLIRLHPFSRTEISEYIRYRLSTAGRNDRSPFSEEAIDVIAQASHGIPRNINGLCYQALSIGCALHKTTIDGDVLRELAIDIHEDGRRSAPLAGAAGNLTAGWNHIPLRNEFPIWARQTEKRSNRWKLLPAVIATAALFGLFWTTPLPKLKIHQDATQVAESPIAPPIVPTDSQQLADQSQSAHSVQSADENSKEQIPVAPSTVGPPATSTNNGKKTLAKTEGNEQEAKIVSIKQAQTAKAIPRVVFADKKESLYQVALEHYGESSSLIVDKILLENPTFQDRYAIVAVGQRIVLPNLPESSKASTSLKTGTAKRN